MKKKVITALIISSAAGVLILLILFKNCTGDTRQNEEMVTEEITVKSKAPDEADIIAAKDAAGTDVSEELPDAEPEQTPAPSKTPEIKAALTGTPAADPEITEAPQEEEDMSLPDPVYVPEESYSTVQEETDSPVPEETSAADEPAAETPVHTHTWTEITVSVHHDAVTHVIHHEETGHEGTVTDVPAWDEQILISEAWDEQIPFFEVHEICDCGFDFTAAGYQQSDVTAHAKAHALAGESSGWSTQNILTGYVTVHHDAEYRTEHHEAETHLEWIVDQAAWDETVTDIEAYDETVVTGYICTGCGETK